MILEKKIEFYNKLNIEIQTLKDKFLTLSKEWINMQDELKSLPNSPFSTVDNEKLQYLSNELKRLLDKFKIHQ